MSLYLFQDERRRYAAPGGYWFGGVDGGGGGTMCCYSLNITDPHKDVLIRYKDGAGQFNYISMLASGALQAASTGFQPGDLGFIDAEINHPIVGGGFDSFGVIQNKTPFTSGNYSASIKRDLITFDAYRYYANSPPTQLPEIAVDMEIGSARMVVSAAVPAVPPIPDALGYLRVEQYSSGVLLWCNDYYDVSRGTIQERAIIPMGKIAVGPSGNMVICYHQLAPGTADTRYPGLLSLDSAGNILFSKLLLRYDSVANSPAGFDYINVSDITSDGYFYVTTVHTGLNTNYIEKYHVSSATPIWSRGTTSHKFVGVVIDSSGHAYACSVLFGTPDIWRITKIHHNPVTPSTFTVDWCSAFSTIYGSFTGHQNRNVHGAMSHAIDGSTIHIAATGPSSTTGKLYVFSIPSDGSKIGTFGELIIASSTFVSSAVTPSVSTTNIGSITDTPYPETPATPTGNPTAITPTYSYITI